jgi:hypothetical protein
MAKLPYSVFYPIGSKIFKNSDEYSDNGLDYVFYGNMDNSDVFYEKADETIVDGPIYAKANGSGEYARCSEVIGYPPISGVCPSGYTLCEEPRSPNYGVCIADDSTELSCDPVTTATPTPTPTTTPSAPTPTPTPTPTLDESTPTPSVA